MDRRRTKEFSDTNERTVWLTRIGMCRFNKRLILITGASNETIGAVLSQGDPPNDHPIAYMSRSLSKSELNYLTTEKEYLAVIAAVQYFRHYLYGRTFTVCRDHEL